MFDKILPQDLNKMMNQVNKKYFLKLKSMDQRDVRKHNIYKEIAAVKCIIDFRIAYYEKSGIDSQKYRDAAI